MAASYILDAVLGIAGLITTSNTGRHPSSMTFRKWAHNTLQKLFKLIVCITLLQLYGVKSVVCTFSKCHGTWMAPCGARCNKSSGIMHVPLQSEMFQLERLV